MKTRVRNASLLLCGALAIASPVRASAQRNGPEPRARAALPGTLTVTGTQTIAEEGDCSNVVVTITGDVTGTVDDGGGFDEVSLQLWDDGTMKDFATVQIPVGTTQAIDASLSFLGLYLTGAPGVGVLAIDSPGGGFLLALDPFFPTDVAGTCPVCDTAIAGCLAAGKSTLLLKNSADDTKDKLAWKWVKGAETALQDLGDPTATTKYTLCIYAGGDAATVELPAGSSWKALGTMGFAFKDLTGAPNGARKALLKSGAAGKSKALVKGKGGNLPDSPAAGLTLPVTVQLVNDTNATCFEATFGTAIKNDAKKFLAKTP
jgi:hypothetical protein